MWGSLAELCEKAVTDALLQGTQQKTTCGLVAVRGADAAERVSKARFVFEAESVPWLRMAREKNVRKAVGEILDACSLTANGVFPMKIRSDEEGPPRKKLVRIGDEIPAAVHPAKWRKLPVELAQKFIRVLIEAKRLDDSLLLNYLDGCACLQSLSLDNSGITVSQRSLLALRKFAGSLAVLDISRCFAFSEECLIETLSALTALDSLTCARTAHVTNSVLKVLPESLLRVDLTRCKDVTDEGVAALCARCPNLTSVILFGCGNITDRAIESLSSLEGLSEVSFWGCGKITDKAFVPLVSGAQYLSSVNISKCTLLTEAILIPLAGLKNLTFVDFSSLKAFSNDALCRFFRTSEGPLSVVYLSDCIQIDDSVVLSLAESCYETLDRVYLSNDALLTDVSVNALLRLCRKLGVLNISKCAQLVDPFDGVPQSLSLHTLNLSCCKNLSACADELFARFPNLKSFEATECESLLRGFCVADFLVSLPQLSFLDLSGAKRFDFFAPNRYYDPAMLSRNNLKWLLLPQTAVTEEGLLAMMPFLSRLELFSVAGMPAVRFTTVQKLLKSCPFLSRCDLSTTAVVMDEDKMPLEPALSLESFFYSQYDEHKVPNMASLTEFYQHSLLSADAIVLQVSLCRNLRSLCLSRFMFLTDSDTYTILRSCQALQTLDVAGCHLLTDETCAHCGNYGRQLTNVLMKECYLITNAGFCSIVENCARLQSGNFSQCPNLDSGIVETLKDITHAPRLEKLFFVKCPRLRSIFFRELKELRPYLDVST